LRRLEAHEVDLRRRADEVRILIEEGKALASPSDPLLNLKEIKNRYNCGRWAIKEAIKRNELNASEGPHNREYLVRQSELERWLGSKPHRAQTQRVSVQPDDPDAAALAQLEAFRRGAA
jgi:hypothetical protein